MIALEELVLGLEDLAPEGGVQLNSEATLIDARLLHAESIDKRDDSVAPQLHGPFGTHGAVGQLPKLREHIGHKSATRDLQAPVHEERLGVGLRVARRQLSDTPALLEVLLQRQ